jgi:hypothetical protein
MGGEKKKGKMQVVCGQVKESKQSAGGDCLYRTSEDQSGAQGRSRDEGALI